ncbi:hypothetical protein [Curtobacterium sp. ER1/6]|uniref:hypothetical protein n=1 Tax=Curtobacterium sp. ER1/6 TaxID=1891920 RepID=UPI0016705D13|nr:hypothetical protein [Curtobacterium sp. ER1/6]
MISDMSDVRENLRLKSAFGDLQEGVRPLDADLSEAIDALREDCYTLPESVVRVRGESLVADAEALGNREGFEDPAVWIYIKALKNKLSALD